MEARRNGHCAHSNLSYSDMGARQARFAMQPARDRSKLNSSATVYRLKVVAEARMAHRR